MAVATTPLSHEKHTNSVSPSTGRWLPASAKPENRCRGPGVHRGKRQPGGRVRLGFEHNLQGGNDGGRGFRLIARLAPRYGPGGYSSGASQSVVDRTEDSSRRPSLILSLLGSQPLSVTF